jgi:general secretion pathway protein A
VYQRFYGLREAPFELAPNPRFLFLSQRHREAFACLQHGISTRKPLTLLVGEAGTGKTTLLNGVLAAEDAPRVQCVRLSNPTLTRGEFIEFLAASFKLDHGAQQSKTALLLQLEQRLRSETQSRPALLVIDEAQSLSDELLEEVRLLCNVETETTRLIPIVLSGQPELADRINAHGLRQLKQRVGIRAELGAFDLAETAAYVATRIRVAGGKSAEVFSREAIVHLHERSRGIPRMINVICDNALITGYALDQRPVGRDVIEEACRDLDVDGARLSEEAAPAAPAEGTPAVDQPPLDETFVRRLVIES